MKTYEYEDKDFGKILNKIFRDGNYEEKGQNDSFRPLTNLSMEKNNQIVFIEIDVSGFKKDNISVKAENNKLIIEGTYEEEDSEEELKYFQREFKPKNFTKKYRLNSEYDVENTRANIENGILYISILPKKENTKKIKIL